MHKFNNIQNVLPHGVVKMASYLGQDGHLIVICPSFHDS